MKLISVLLISFLLNAMPLNAHELWLEAKEYQIKKDDKLIVNIKVGQNLIGESYPYLKEETEKLFIKNKKQIFNIKQLDGDYPAIQQSLKEKDTQYLYYQSSKEFLEYKDYDTFLDFTKEYNLSYNTNNKKIPKEIYQRFAKLIFKYDGQKFYQSNQNLEFEIFNLNDPYQNNITEVKIYLKDKSFNEKKFIVFLIDGNGFGKKEYQTDKDGFAKIDTSKNGLYLISAVHLETLNFLDQIKFKADYFSRWASLTFRKN